jgi:hypothetical protein
MTRTPILRRIAGATLVAFVATTVVPAYAGTIPTDAAFAIADRGAAHARLDALLARAEFREGLIAQGVDPALVEARVARLTDAEADALAGRIESMPAGGDIVGTVVFVFLVLLITDLLGWTDVFPFTNKGSIGK